MVGRMETSHEPQAPNIPVGSDDSDASDCSEEWVDPAAAQSNLTRMLESTKQECEGEQERAIKSAVRKARREEAKRWEGEVKAAREEQDAIHATPEQMEGTKQEAYKLVLQTAKLLLQQKTGSYLSNNGDPDSVCGDPEWRKKLVQYVVQASNRISAEAAVCAREEAEQKHLAALEGERERAAQAVADATVRAKEEAEQKHRVVLEEERETVAHEPLVRHRTTGLICNNQSRVNPRASHRAVKASSVLWMMAEMVQMPIRTNAFDGNVFIELVRCMDRYLDALMPACISHIESPTRSNVEALQFSAGALDTELRLVYELFLRFMRSTRLEHEHLDLVSSNICQKLVARLSTSSLPGERVLLVHVVQQVRRHFLRVELFCVL
jgi:hypothetical protein